MSGMSKLAAGLLFSIAWFLILILAQSCINGQMKNSLDSMLRIF